MPWNKYVFGLWGHKFLEGLQDILEKEDIKVKGKFIAPNSNANLLMERNLKIQLSQSSQPPVQSPFFQPPNPAQPNLSHGIRVAASAATIKDEADKKRKIPPLSSSPADLVSSAVISPFSVKNPAPTSDPYLSDDDNAFQCQPAKKRRSGETQSLDSFKYVKK